MFPHRWQEQVNQLHPNPAEEALQTRESAPQPEVLGSAHGLQPHRPVIMAERTVVSAAGVLSPRVAGSWQLASPPPVALCLCSANIFVPLQRDQHRVAQDSAWGASSPSLPMER